MIKKKMKIVLLFFTVTNTSDYTSKYDENSQIFKHIENFKANIVDHRSESWLFNQLSLGK